jgi:hypothetical protein
VLAELFADPITARKSLNDKVGSVADDVANSAENVIKVSE